MYRKIFLNKWEIFWMLYIEREIDSKSKWRFYECICECWWVKIVRQDHLTWWRIRSCGCLQKIKTSKAKTTHWMTNTRFWRIYKNLFNRCNYKKYPEFNYYWWRWIKCEWEKFEDFRDDMYESYLEHSKIYWEKNTTIDRVNVNWNYCGKNCRWATYKIQANNKRWRK